MTVQSVGQGKSIFGDGDTGFNIVKFLLSVFAMSFDIIFMVQHYILYRGAHESLKKRKDRKDALEMHNSKEL